jgi:hypothetical protein
MAWRPELLCSYVAAKITVCVTGLRSQLCICIILMRDNACCHDTVKLIRVAFTDEIWGMLSASPEYFVFPTPLRSLEINTYKAIILLVILYGRETWSLTLRQEHRLRVFGNRVLRRIFGTKR